MSRLEFPVKLEKREEPSGSVPHGFAFLPLKVWETRDACGSSRPSEPYEKENRLAEIPADCCGRRSGLGLALLGWVHGRGSPGCAVPLRYAGGQRHGVRGDRVCADMVRRTCGNQPCLALPARGRVH